MMRRRYNPARQQAAALAHLGRSYLRDTAMPADDAAELRRAVEAVELGAEALIRAIETADECAVAGVMSRLAGVLADAFIIGNRHYDAKDLRLMRRLATKIMRDRRVEKRQRLELHLDKTYLKLVKSDKFVADIRDDVRGALVCKPDDTWPSVSVLRRAIGAVLKQREIDK
jgi:hypothetical protein